MNHDNIQTPPYLLLLIFACFCLNLTLDLILVMYPHLSNSASNVIYLSLTQWELLSLISEDYHCISVSHLFGST